MNNHKKGIAVRLSAVRRACYALALVLALGGSTAAAADTLKVGFLPISTHGKFMIAQEKGFYAQEGLEVELIEFHNSADGLHALTSNKIDVGAFGTSAPLIHISKGADIKIIGGITSGGSSFIARPEVAATIKTPADLKGKKIATVRLSTVDAILRGALQDAGLDWKKDVEIFELKNAPAVTAAVKSGQVDVGATWGPHDLRAEKEGMKIVFYSHELYPSHVCCRLIVGGKADPVVSEKFLRAILRAEKYAAENREGTLDVLAKYVRIDRATLETDFYDPYKDNSTDPYLKGLRQFWTVMDGSGFIEAKGRSIDGAVNLDLYRKALQGLVREQPNEPYWQKLLADFKAKNSV
ncbi:ABC transporter substrate-binding protein [Pseudothauera rhizosphaerae]|uniref:ABC transporter substrate-binding protein n=1 Tax=Pseudothauera rhizosphaerae TaxID=2565932 RepID=A0A4S4AYL2_9RHOO|nr:ABC transporter substrate-binding protein [Pseudothauera rhizosphaerae]THF65246.1 ABC transporter substrate-binding protein [Pseudothauera rhizosphaerae]